MQEQHLTNIKNELAKINGTDQYIAELFAQYGTLTIGGKLNKVGYERVHKARVHVRDFRLNVEETRKVLKADSLEYGRAVDGEANRIKEKVSPLEARLIGEEEAYKIECEAEAKAKQKSIDDLKQHRIDELLKCGVQFNGTAYYLPTRMITLTQIEMLVDDAWQQELANFQAESKQIADAKQAEDESRIRVVAAQQIEAERLAAQKAEQDKKSEELREQERKIQHEKDIERAKLEAVETERRRLETEARCKEDERLAELAEHKRKAELESDQSKLLTYLLQIVDIQKPNLTDKKAKEILKTITTNLRCTLEEIEKMK